MITFLLFLYRRGKDAATKIRMAIEFVSALFYLARFDHRLHSITAALRMLCNIVVYLHNRHKKAAAGVPGN